MCEGNKASCKRRKKQQQAACVCCTITLVLILIIILILYFSVFKPSDPNVQVPMMQLLEITLPANQSLSFNLDLQIAVYNPNHAAFYIEAGSTACVYYHGYQAGFTSISPSFIPSQSSSTFSVTLVAQASSPLQGIDYLNSDVASGTLPVTTSVTIMGEVTTLGTFSHHSDVVSKCNVYISVNYRAIQSYNCQSSYSLDWWVKDRGHSIGH